ncbi:methyltransferase domain-containing protein [Candidatus Woesearchaeota archaeon]|nr:methyltransferase domain-containing protein [Candidatus Woesearchaeota archaeon]MBT6520290.1 methyltransferase domain-containing protein [Candidatus Woesearchaeota archaeon]MBT7367310.1 methyltransferase domain-containing protein [Candidatus Woesearchaeota archaeon]
MYEPQEDSYLMYEQIKKVVKSKHNVLEIGVGSGILAFETIKQANEFIGVDINPNAIEFCKKKLKEKVKNKKIESSQAKKSKFITSDLFEKIQKKKEKKFDIIIFNPPYLPHDPREPKDCALATCGGKHGYELIEKFLDQAHLFLKPRGQIFLLFSSLTKKEKVDEFVKNNLLESELVAEKKIPFEKLYIYNITKHKLHKLLEKKGVSNIKKLTSGHRGFIFTGNYKQENKKTYQKDKSKSKTKKENITKIAIKIQRSDIDAIGTVNNESSKLKSLNKYNIGPELLFYGNNYFAYEFVEGIFPLEFYQEAKRSEIIASIKTVFDQMFKLDQLGLNKEEMHHPVKHIVISKTKQNKIISTLLDFERCKHTPNPQNITQFCQFITSGLVKPLLEQKKINIDKKLIRKLAKQYKENQTKENFELILKEIN